MVAHQITFMNKRLVHRNATTPSLCAVLAMGMAVTAVVHGEVVYDGVAVVANDKGFNGVVAGKGPLEFGDDLTLTGTARLVNHFVFQYFGDIADNVVAMATLRFYANDAIIPGKSSLAPGSLLWQSDPFKVAKGDNIATVNVPNIPVGDTFTFSLEVPGLAGVSGNQFLLHTTTRAADVGKSFNDLWVKSGAVWSLLQLGSPAGSQRADFAVQISAVPEPSSLALGGLGALTFGWFALRRRSQN